MSNVSVLVIVDSVGEGPNSEEFDLRLNVSSLVSPAITAGGRDMATGIIIDSNS